MPNPKEVYLSPSAARVADAQVAARVRGEDTVILTARGAETLTVSHRLGRTPVSWTVTRANPARGVTGAVCEGEQWDKNVVSFKAPGSGEWQITLR